METIQALIDALKEFKGGLLVVSHDQHFISQVSKDPRFLFFAVVFCIASFIILVLSPFFYSYIHT